jgi:triphosphoribosyl-dephospho-CoA synthase CitG
MCQTADSIARSIYDALLKEVRTTPKPGLVDLFSQGAHRDLSVELFERSAQVLKPTFRAIAELALGWEGELEALFAPVRELGLAGEQAMFAATGGVNTHKGALFSLGILAAVTGYAIKAGLGLESDRLCLLASAMTKRTLEKEFSQMTLRPGKTHGELLYLSRGHRGIRGEVMDGFPTIRTHILPLLPPDRDLRDAECVHLLLVLMAKLEDTNVLSRGGEQALSYVQASAEQMLLLEPTQREAEFIVRLEQLDQAFIERNLSSGGAADLLGVTLYLHTISRLLQP